MDLQSIFDMSDIKAIHIKTRHNPMLTRYVVMTRDPREVKRNEDLLKMYLCEDIVVSYGNGVINIDVPKKDRDIIGIRNILDHCEKFDVPIGLCVDETILYESLKEMCHILVAGSTNSGKSTFMRSAIGGLMAMCEPHELRLLLIDTNQIDLTIFDGLPHLLSEVVINADDAISALERICVDMRQRMALLSQSGCSDIDTYNKSNNAQIPRILIAIDEFADLMYLSQSKVEDLIQIISRMGRKCGVHLMLGTQSPRADVVSGIVKACLPTIIGLKTSNARESRIIIDQDGCETLIGKGDGIYKGRKGIIRFQSCFSERSEIEDLVDSWKEEFQSYESHSNYHHDDIIDVEFTPHNHNEHQETYAPVIYQRRLTLKEKYIANEINRFKMGINDIKRRFKCGTPKANYYKKIAEVING